MSTGISSRLLLPTRARWQAIERRTSIGARLHDLAFDPAFPPPVAMLRDARDKYVATAPKKKPLEKELFPSSSPGASHNGNIDQIFKQPSRSTSFFGSQNSRQPYKSSPPLKQRSTNVSHGTSATLSTATLSKSSQAFASICAKQDSFQDSPNAIDLTGNDSRSLSGGAGSRYIAGVLINDDDFDDDDDLDIDSVPLTSLPTLPPRDTRPATIGRSVPPPPTDTSILSWSQSSDRHFQPSHVSSRSIQPPPPQRTSNNQSAKRESPDQVSSPPVAKKRALPSSFQRRNHVQDEEEEYTVRKTIPVASTPAPKKPNTLWNATASAVQAQKKQLKTQLKKSSDTMPENSTTSQAQRTAKARSAAISLSNEQRHVKQLVVEKGQSVFFTGPAGTGKSVLMRAIIQDFKRKYARDQERVAVTASTGLAACNIGGMTLHSFSGIGLGKEDVGTLVKKIRRNPKAKNRWLRTKVLIMDEVSMVDGELFDKLSQIGRTIRNNGRPWGGIQLVITGDFFQLPPVPDHGGKQRESKFAFEAATWNTSIDHTIGLTEVFRQRDPVFADMLNEMRLGRISEGTVQNFKALSRPLEFTDGLEVTELFPTRNEVESSNERRLRALPGEVYRYEALDTGAPEVRDRLLQNMMAPKALELKKGAQVMLIKNMDDTLVNGSLGTVEAFMSETTFEAMPPDDGSVDAAVKKRISAFTNELDKKSTSGDNTKYPLVRFHATDGTSRMLLIVPEDWKVELPTGEVQASRKQIPLILAWALSIHKAQGQTLERVKVDLGRVFEKGQAYVALSRATTQEGLQVLRFQKDRVMAHPRVIGFYNKLYSAESATTKKTTTSISNFVYRQGSHGTGKDLRDGPDEDEEAMVAAYG